MVYAIDADGNLYNERGYKTGHRVRSGGAEMNVDKCVCTGFISVKNGDVVRISGCNFKEVSAQNAINIYDKNFTNLGQIALNSDWGYGNLANTSYAKSDSVIEEKSGVYKWIIPPEQYGTISYIRVSCKTYYPRDLVITVNQEINYLP